MKLVVRDPLDQLDYLVSRELMVLEDHLVTEDHLGPRVCQV